jgi:hypothetical protein
MGVDSWKALIKRSHSVKITKAKTKAKVKILKERNTFINCDQFVFLDPVKFVCIDLVRGSAFPLHGLEGLRKGLHIFRNAKNELVVTDINGATDQSTALRVCSGNDQVLTAHHIPLEPGGDQSVDVFAHGYEYLARKMATLLSAMELILEMDRRSTIFCEQFGKLENRRETTMSVTIDLANDFVHCRQV